MIPVSVLTAPMTQTVERYASLAAVSNSCLVFLHALKILGHLLSHHVLYIDGRFRCVKKLIATLLVHLTCHPLGRANCIWGKIKRAGWSVATSFISLQFIIGKVNVGNPFSRWVWQLVDIQNCLWGKLHGAGRLVSSYQLHQFLIYYHWT